MADERRNTKDVIVIKIRQRLTDIKISSKDSLILITIIIIAKAC